jgi:hypothetical protein
VAEPDLARPGQGSRADAPGEPLRGANRTRAQRLGDAIAAHALGLEVGAHAVARDGHAPVGVDQEQPDAVVELPVDRVALVREQPAGLLGG